MSGGNASTPGPAERLAGLSTPVVTGFLFAFFVGIFVIGEVVIAKVDTDAHQGLAQRHGVRGLPTLVLFVDGEPAERLVGMQDETRLRQLLASHAD